MPQTSEKDVYDADDLADYEMIAKQTFGTQKEREAAANAWVLDNLSDLKKRRIRRMEWMACQIIDKGKISVSQDNIEFEVAFGFNDEDDLADGGHIIDITGTAANKWSNKSNGESTANPLKDIRNWTKTVRNRYGIKPTMAFIESTAADAFLENTWVIKYLDTNNIKAGRLDTTQSMSQAGISLGNFGGVEIFEYNQQYEDDDGENQDMISAGKFILTVPSADDNHVHYGPIARINDSNKVQSFVGKELLEAFRDRHNTSLEWWLSSCFCPITKDPDSILSVKVI